MSNPKLNFKEETSAKKTRSPPEKANVEQTQPKKKKLKLDTDKAKEKAQHLRFGKAELTPDDLRRLSKEQKREMYAAALARSAAHREIDQYEEDNVGVQALSEGEKAAGNVQDFSKSRYSRKLKKKAKMQAKKKARTTKSSTRQPDKAQNAGDSNIPHGDSNEGGSNWLSRWKQRQEIRNSLKAYDNIRLFTEHIRNLSFSFVSPVCSYNGCYHSHSSLMSRFRGTDYLHQKAHALILYMKIRCTSTSFAKLIPFFHQ